MKLNWSKKYKHIFSYTNKKGTFWGYRYPYYDTFRKRKELSKRGFETERTAHKALISVQNDVENDTLSFIENKQITVDQWIAQWIPYAEDNWSLSTQKNNLSAIKFHISPLLGNVKLSAINKITYKKIFIDVLRAENKYADSTIHSYHKIVMSMINAAVENQIIPSNTIKGFKFDLSNNARSFTKEELRKFTLELENQNLRNQTIFYTFLKTGLRKGELLGLKWDDINLDELYFDIKCTRGDYGEKEPKTKDSKRKVYFDESLANLIKKYQNFEKQAFLKKGKKLKSSEYFILSNFSLPINQSIITQIFRKICTKAEIENITVHGLRHTHATFLIEAGANIKYVSNRLGHKNIKTTLDIYSDVLKSKEVETALLMDQILNTL